MPFITDAHVGKQSAKKLQAVTPVQIQERWNLSWEAWQFEIDKFTLTEKWYRAYEKHIRVGEDWRDSFRFPELFGAIRRKYDNLIEFLPEVKIKGDGDGVIALQSAYEHQARVSNLQREKQRAMLDAVKTGTGCLFCAPTRNERTVKGDKGKPEQRLLYDGLAAERIDPRDLIPAYSSLIMHDHTGQQACPYVFRRRIYYMTLSITSILVQSIRIWTRSLVCLHMKGRLLVTEHLLIEKGLRKNQEDMSQC